MADDDDPSQGQPPAPGAPRRQEWSAQEKLRAVIETSQLEGEALGEYLRRGGLHLAQVQQWREEATEALEPRRGGPAPTAGAERRRIKELERELRKKEKALAETAALLVLRKKLNALWGDGDDDTDDKSEP